MFLELQALRCYSSSRVSTNTTSAGFRSFIRVGPWYSTVHCNRTREGLKGSFFSFFSLFLCFFLHRVGFRSSVAEADVYFARSGVWLE